MPPEGSITLRSTQPRTELELAWQGEGIIHAAVRDKGLVAESDVWWNDHMDEPASLASFFEDMAANWKGWTGTKEWRSAESPFALSGVHDGLGHVFIDVELRSGWYDGDWSTRVRIVFDAGGLDQVASNLRAFLMR